jgi:hypothetical protein
MVACSRFTVTFFYYSIFLGLAVGFGYIAYNQRDAIEDFVKRFFLKDEKYRYGDLNRVPESAIDDYPEDKELINDFDPRN